MVVTPVQAVSTSVTNFSANHPYKRGLITWLAAFMAAFFCLSAQAGVIEAEGYAPLDLGSIDLVRETAILEAVKQGELQSGAQVESYIALSPNGTPLESARVRAAGELSKVRLIKEWSDGKLLHVVVQGSSDPCNAGLSNKSRTYKKRIITSRFEIPNVASVSDLPDIWRGLSTDIRNRLDKSGKFISFATERHVYQNQIDTLLAAESNRKHITEIASEHDAQFVVIGTLINAGMKKGEYFWQEDERQFEIEVGVYDGLSGAKIGLHRDARIAKGDVTGTSDKPFGSAAFFETAYGKSVTSALDKISHLIETDVGCLPFTAKIIRIDGKKIFFNAGTTSGVEAGDKLVVYLREKDFPTQGISGRKVGGVPENPLAAIQVIQVQPLFAVAELTEDSGQVKLREGDLIRFESRR